MNTETPKINPPDTEFRAWAAEIVSAYIGNNPVAVTDVPPLIAQVHHVLSRLGTQIEPAVERPQPAVPIKKSVTPEWIICLEDGKKVKMLRRHLQKVYDMTPQQYRQRWGQRGRDKNPLERRRPYRVG